MLVALMALLPVTSAASAQDLGGVLVDADSGRPIPGAMLVASGITGAVAGRTLSDDDGRFLMSGVASETVSGLRVVRIGYATQEYAGPELAADSLVLRVPSAPIELEGFGVVAEKLCGDDFERSERVYDVWLEARKALELTRFTESERVLGFGAEHIVTILDAGNRDPLEREVEPRQLLGEKPYYSLSVEEMTVRGWAREDENGGVLYFAPDVTALLSDEFAAQHCYGAEVRDDEILLTFAPNRARQSLPELEGELVLDRESYALDRLRFTYTSLPLPRVAQGYAGGEIHFTAAPNGLWIVREWSIRVPLLDTRVRIGAGGVSERIVVRELREERGRVLRIHAGGEVFDLSSASGR